jgi:transcriptional regulator with XRE-family HTH domain
MASKRQRFMERRRAQGYSQEAFAEAVGTDRSTVGRWERGEVAPQPWQRPKLMRALDVTAVELDGLLAAEVYKPAPLVPSPWLGNGGASDSDEYDALELARRVQASDVGEATLVRLERAFDELATQYPVTPPQDLLGRVRQYSAYVGHLLDAKKTLGEHRRLLVVGGWLSLLGATLHIDLKQDSTASARLQTAAALAHEAGHDELHAWCYETTAWRVLTDGDYEQAVKLSQAAQALAPTGTSAAIQATAQEGRARARLGQAKETYAAIGHVQEMSAALGMPEQTEHHYQYDPAKSVAYTATTLAWLGDPSAETYAREVIARLSPGEDMTKWPRRVASANIDLALALLIGDRLDEACDATQKAIESGRVVPSNHWRALEVVKAVEAKQLPEATDLREAYQFLKGQR